MDFAFYRHKTVFVFSIIAISLMLWLRVTVTFNSAYVDESDYLFVGQLLLDGIHWNTKSYIFSSDIPLILIGLAGQLNGLFSARLLSVVLGLFSLLLAYRLYRQFLVSQPLGLFATIFLAVSAGHIFISKFATYDIICFTFLLLSFCFLWSSQKKYADTIFIIIGAGVFVLAVLSKYILIAYWPLVFLILLWRQKLQAFIFLLISFLCFSVYVYMNYADLQLLYQNQIVGTHTGNTDRLEVLAIILQYLVLLLPGVLWCLYKYKKYFYIFIMALPLLFYHCLAANSIAVYKHVVFSVFFLSPLAVIGLNELMKKNQRYTLLVLSVFVCCSAGLSFWQVKTIEQSYPNTTLAVKAIQEKLQKTDKVMSENPYLLREALYPVLGLEQLQDTHYYDGNKDGVYERQDVIDSLWDGQFDYVYLDGRFHPEFSSFLREKVIPERYDLLYGQAYQTQSLVSRNNHGKISVYKLRD